MITRKKDVFDAKIVNTSLTKIFMGIFAPDERLPSSATLFRAKVANPPSPLPCGQPDRKKKFIVVDDFPFIWN